MKLKNDLFITPGKENESILVSMQYDYFLVLNGVFKQIIEDALRDNKEIDFNNLSKAAEQSFKKVLLGGGFMVSSVQEDMNDVEFGEKQFESKTSQEDSSNQDYFVLNTFELEEEEMFAFAFEANEKLDSIS